MEPNKDSIKQAIKDKIKKKLKKELLEEIYDELKAEEDDITKELESQIFKKNIKEHAKEKPAPIISKKEKAKTTIAVKAILKVASHALKYAHQTIPQEQWVEVIGLLAGYLEGDILHIADAYPMGHGNAVYAEIKDYKNFVRAYKDISKENLFICGWYHSHPSYGCWMSDEDIGTQARYQKLWDKAVALVVDPYMIDGTSVGFEIFRADLKSNKWYAIPYKIMGSLDVKMLPEILNFMNPIIEGKAAYLEYDED